MRWVAVVLLGLCSCNAQLARRTDQSPEQILLLEELRIALADVKQAQRAQALDVALLEEKVSKLERPGSSLEPRLAAVEKTQDHLQSDLKAVKRYAEETASATLKLEQEIAEIARQTQEGGKRLDEVAHLRSTISSLTKAMSSSSKETKTHRVRPGDSLEKIARLYDCSIEAIRKANPRIPSGPNPKILVGQEIQIPVEACR
jgi:LysM repeat protein